MATSGSFSTNDAGIGSSYPDRATFNWWQNSQDIGSNKTNISFDLKADGGASSWWSQYFNTSLNVDGQGWSVGSTKGYQGQVLISGSKDIWHNNDGSKSFSASAQTGITTTAINSRGSGSWSLNNIPRHASITNTSGDVDDSVTNPWVEFSNPAGTAVNAYLEILINGSIVGNFANRDNVRSRHTWTLTTAERNTMLGYMANVNSATFRYTIHDKMGGTDSWSTRDNKITIKNANPVFSNFTYRDKNATSSAITGDNQVLIQGVSVLETTISSANKAVPQKQATMKTYAQSFSNLSKSVNYSTSDIVTELGTPTGSGSLRLNVVAQDSRGNKTTAYKDVNVIPYSAPVLNASLTRKNNFEALTTVSISGSISPIANKNGLEGIQYRYKEASSSTWGVWTQLTTPPLTDEYKFNVPTFNLTLDNTKQYTFEFMVGDKLRTTTISRTVDVGIPIFRISTADNKLYNQEHRVITEAPIVMENYSGSILNLVKNAYPADRRTWLFPSDGSTANVSDKPLGSTNKSMSITATLVRNASSSDYAYEIEVSLNVSIAGVPQKYYACIGNTASTIQWCRSMTEMTTGPVAYAQLDAHISALSKFCRLGFSTTGRKIYNSKYASFYNNLIRLQAGYYLMLGSARETDFSEPRNIYSGFIANTETDGEVHMGIWQWTNQRITVPLHRLVNLDRATDFGVITWVDKGGGNMSGPVEIVRLGEYRP